MRFPPPAQDSSIYSFYLFADKIVIMYQWKKQDNKLPLAVMVVVLVAILISVLIKPAGIPFSLQMIPDLSTVGFVKVEPDAAVSGGAGVVSLTGNCYQMTANTEAVQAESILNGINKAIAFRPGTHDLIKDAFDNLKIKVVMVKIVDLRNNTFFGRLILQSGDTIVNLDSRPSDGIAIAVRADAPIYIKEDLLKQQGKYIC